MMRHGRIPAHAALLPDGWARDVRITADAAGWITAVEPAAAAGGADRLRGAVIPGMPNLHSHAFQRAMAGPPSAAARPGRTASGAGARLMYRFADRLTPEDVEAIAAQLYVEMLRMGLHRRLPNSTTCTTRRTARPMRSRPRWRVRHLAAARRTGIGITLLPVLYRHGGIFGGCRGAGAAALPERPRPLSAHRRGLPRGDGGRSAGGASASRRTACAR